MKFVRFGDLCTLQNGRAFKPEEWSESGVPIIRIQNLNDESKPFNYCSFEVDERFWIKSGDLLFSWSGTPGTSFGAFFWNRGRGFLNQHIFRVDVTEELITKQYLQYALNSLIIKIIDQAHGGVGLKHITKAKLEEIKIPLPPLEEQRRIAEILDKADSLIQKRKASIAKLDELLQATFIDMFGDPVTNPKGWEIGTLENLGNIDRGISKHRPRGAPELLGGNHPLIQTGDVARSKGYIRTYSSTYSDIGLAQSKKWNKGTLCITIAANIANTGILMFDACFPDSIVGFTSNKNSNTEFVQGLFSFFQQILEEKAPQSAQKNINLAILRSLEIPIPPKELQDKWAEFATAVEEQKSKMQTQLEAQETLFKALQQQAFSGQL